ncbi:GAF domain-containing sensor histidine kinase [Streptomyces aidingensis]|uniref:Histidine kinase-, DNA gyrase B-, and HSP90-like ATPase n=1 Tax=Streptomyces aidingensis TaxID=910347 RepID=A0A1I1QM81_9ACTN|nr:GAF domain-containing protein [Streptomyces aidingensis]SFD20958.1 Histidine kinase-, DNA gyrase B-, and HSP90-like ATPase [Streptomyces aidingensis]
MAQVLPADGGPPPRPSLSERLPRLLEAMVAIGGDVEMQTLLDRVLTAAGELTGARYAAVGVLDEEGGLGRFVTRGIEPELRKRIEEIPGTDRLVRRMVERPRPLLLDDLTQDPRFTGFPTAGPAIRSLLGSPIRVHGVGFGALYLAQPHPAAFTPEDLQLTQILATEAGIAIGNARLYEAVRQRARWMDGSAELSTSLLSDDSDNALAVVAEQAMRLADADAAFVMTPAEDGGLEIVAACAGDPSGLIGTVVPAGSETVRQLLAGEPVFIEDSAADSDLPRAVAHRYGPSMLLPLASDGKVIGALAVPRGPGGEQFTFAERAMATQFAQQAALALVLSAAQRDREQLAVYEDRDRIARDLHDLVIQRLFATGMLLETAQRAAGSPDVSSRIGKAVNELDATIQEIRTAIFALQQGPEEAPAGLRTRVLRETGTAARTLGFQPSVAFQGPVDARVGEGVAKNLIAALREGLSNAARHAHAGRVEVTVDASGTLPDGRDSVRLTVADDGIGLPEHGGRRSGLRNLAQRARSLGGGVSFGPGPGGSGTTLSWEVPL